MSHSPIPNPGSFVSRVQSQSPKPLDTRPTVMEAENDFPFTSIDFVRIGSGHTVCAPQHDDENLELMHRLITHIMQQYERDESPSPVEIESK